MTVTVPSSFPPGLEARTTSARTTHQNGRRSYAGTVEVLERALAYLCGHPPCAAGSARAQAALTSATTAETLTRVYLPPFCRRGRVVGLLSNENTADTITVEVELSWDGNTRTAARPIVISASTTPTVFEVPIEVADADGALDMTSEAYADLTIVLTGDTLQPSTLLALTFVPDQHEEVGS